MFQTNSRPLRLAVTLAALVLIGWLPLAQGAERNAALTAALNSIVASQLQAHVNLLADDTMEGREAGTSGGRAAADYLIERLKQLGLAEAGDQGGYDQPFGSGYRNVLALLKGRDPELAAETVVVCAHYDHIGRGSRKTSLGTIGKIHNGADDNASGVSAILELAEAFCCLPEAPRRSVLFAFWDAEEKGLLGSKHWASAPTVPREGLVAAINIDMIGRLRDNQITLFGSRTGEGFRRLVSMSNGQSDLRIDFSRTLQANADHYPFVQRDIPVLFAHTGVHEQYHRETDDADLIDSEGMERITRMLFGVAYDLAERPDRARFRTACRREAASGPSRSAPEIGAVPHRFGVAWDPQQTDEHGIKLTSVRPGSPADTAGIRPGDRVLEMAGHAIHSGEDLAGAVLSAVNPVHAMVEPREGDESREVVIQLDGNPLRLGVTWEVDEAEPGTVVLKQVFSGSAAARAGLRPGDRVYRVAGRDFSDDEQFAEWATTLPGPLEFLVERQGRLVHIVVHFADEEIRRAA